MDSPSAMIEVHDTSAACRQPERVTRAMTVEPSVLIGNDQQPAAYLRKAAVLAIVVGPFLATAFAIVQLWDMAVSWRDILLLVGLYILISLGVTAGFHRMLTHRSFRAHPAVRGALLILGSMAIEGPPIEWAANHLKHHALADRAGDPSSPVHGLVHSHLGWLLSREAADPGVYCRALLHDRIVVFVHRLFPFWVVLSLVIPFALGGWTGLLWGGLVRVF